MALLQNIRKRGKLLAIVIGIALAAFIIGDLINSSTSIFRSQERVVAVVNDNSIDYEQYQRKIQETEQYVKLSQGKQSIDEQTSQQIRSSVWDMLIRNHLLENTFDELGLFISKQELEDMVVGNQVHPMVAQTFVNPETGQFDKNLVANVLQNINKDPKINTIWLYIENYIKKDRVFQKYQILVSKAVYANKLEVQDNYTARNKTVNIDIVAKTINTISDSSISYSEEDVKKYYEEHKKLFKTNQATRDISYISFKVEPSEQDTSAIYKKAKDNIDILEKTEENLLRNVTYYSKDDLSSLGIDSTVFSMPVDTIIGPVLAFNSYQLIKVLGFDERPDTVSARHILISPQNESIADMNRAQKVADSLVNVIKNGGDFGKLALEYSDDQGSAQKGGLYEDITEGQMVKEFNDFVFSEPVGEIGTVSTDYGVHIVEVTQRKSMKTKVKLAVDEYKIIPSQNTYDSVYSYAMKTRGQIDTGKTFDQVVEENDFVVKEANDITNGTYQIPGLDNTRQVVRWTYEAEQNDVSSVIEMTNQYIIAKLTQKNEIGFLSLEDVRKQVENSVIQEKKVDKIYNEYFSDIKVESLDKVASKVGETKITVPKVSFNAFQLSTFGYEPAVLAAATNAKQGEIVGPVKGKNGVYVFAVNKINEAPELSSEQFEKEKQNIIRGMQNNANYQAYNALKNASEIEDKRAKFY